MCRFCICFVFFFFLQVLRHVSSEGKDLVRRLLARDPEDRPSARQMLSHPWLRAVITRAKATGTGKGASTSTARAPVRHGQHGRPVGVGAAWGVTLQRDATAGAGGGGGNGAEPKEERQQALV